MRSDLPIRCRATSGANCCDLQRNSGTDPPQCRPIHLELHTIGGRARPSSDGRDERVFGGLSHGQVRGSIYRCSAAEPSVPQPVVRPRVVFTFSVLVHAVGRSLPSGGNSRDVPRSHRGSRVSTDGFGRHTVSVRRWRGCGVPRARM